MRLGDLDEALRMIENSRSDNPFFNGKTSPVWEAAHDCAITCVTACPTIDAVPVVRCGECRFWQDNNGGYPHDECRWGKDETPDADDFCSYGEKKDGG